MHSFKSMKLTFPLIGYTTYAWDVLLILITGTLRWMSSKVFYHYFKQRNPLQSFPKIHGKTGVTNIIFHGDTVYTTGRDGCYRVFSHNSGHMTLLNTYRVYKGFEWIDRLDIAEEGADYHVFGFQSVNKRLFFIIISLYMYFTINYSYYVVHKEL